MSNRYVIRIIQASLLLAVATCCAAAEPETGSSSSYSQWPNGPSSSPNFFPIAVWLQSPTNAPRFQAAGINLFVGLWEGPTQEQLDTLAKCGMRVISGQNAVSLTNLANPIIAGWMHGDEPDDSQWAGRFGPPVSTAKVQRNLTALRAADPSRPVLLNLGQGVAWDNYNGRGLRRNHPEDYLEYVKDCDIASFDIYPVVHEDPAVKGKLEFVAHGVERLVKWNAGKPVWNCIECTHISNPNAKATPAQVRTEVWMSLIHGSRGLIYFVHQFKPKFREPALLDDPEMLTAVTALNKQIHELAPVLNSPTLTNGVSVTSPANNVPIATMMKRHGNSTYVFSVCMRNVSTTARFKVSDLPESSSAEVLNESRTITLKAGEFTDDFKPYDVHLYRIAQP